MRFVCVLFIAVAVSSCSHDYWKMQAQTEDLRLKNDHAERMFEKCIDVCGVGNVKTCAARMGQVECHKAN